MRQRRKIVVTPFGIKLGTGLGATVGIATQLLAAIERGVFTVIVLVRPSVKELFAESVVPHSVR